jgi:hypothetical protein
MSEFIKAQQELRANLAMQIRDVIDSAEADKRGLDAAELKRLTASKLTSVQQMRLSPLHSATRSVR